MNERIRELAKTYLIHERFGPDGESTIEDYYEFYPEELEYFVGLIVQECAEICLEMAAKCAGLPGDGALAKDCAYWIKNDFGVEE